MHSISNYEYFPLTYWQIVTYLSDIHCGLHSFMEEETEAQMYLAQGDDWSLTLLKDNFEY